MRVVLQRVSRASVTVESETVGAIGAGFLVLLGVADGDDESDIDWLVGKIAKMRVFADDAGLMNRSMLDEGFAALVVSQLTLHASTRKGNRPSFQKAAPPAEAERLYEQFCESLETLLGEGRVARGRFAAEMQVELVNDGPVTIVVDSRARE